jgi:hypothetical protein
MSKVLQCLDLIRGYREPGLLGKKQITYLLFTRFVYGD